MEYTPHMAFYGIILKLCGVYSTPGMLWHILNFLAFSMSLLKYYMTYETIFTCGLYPESGIL